jgi:hypothetical protein
LCKKEIDPNIKFASPIARTVPVSEKTNKSEEDLFSSALVNKLL